MMGVRCHAHACPGHVTIAAGAGATQLGVKAAGEGTESIARGEWDHVPRARLASVGNMRASMVISNAASRCRGQAPSGALWGSCCRCPNGGAA